MAESGAGRWWENYLVRYFMPSIAGMAIVAWLVKGSSCDVSGIIFLTSQLKIDVPTLVLLALYGNLFCYIASYPVLCFHATRAIDFSGYRWKWKRWYLDGYLSTLAFLGVVAIIATLLSSWIRVLADFALVAGFSGMQLARIAKSIEKDKVATKRYTQHAYAYLMRLARRRGVLETNSTERQRTNLRNSGPATTSTREMRWRQEIQESYRHMREHGNSGFIFMLELGLAAACYGLMQLPHINGTTMLSLVGVLFAVWSIPSMFIHLMGQGFERRYSHFDSRKKRT